MYINIKVAKRLDLVFFLRLYLNCCLVAKSFLTLLWPFGWQPTRLPCPWDFPGKNTVAGFHFLLQGNFPTQGLNPGLLHCQGSSDLNYSHHKKEMIILWHDKRCCYGYNGTSMLSWFSNVRLFATLWTAALQATQSMRFFRQEYWRVLPFPSPGHLPNFEVEPTSLTSPTLAGGLPLAPPRKPAYKSNHIYNTSM